MLTSPIVSHTDLRAARRRAVPASRQSRMSVNLQAQIRDNSRDLTAFLRDLNEWTGDVKEKDAALASRDARDAPASASSSGGAQPPPPVRGRVAEHVVASEADLKARREASRAAAPAPPPASAARTETPARDGSNDGHRSAIRSGASSSSPSSSSHKDMGNAAFKAGQYERAIEHYTRSVSEDGETAAAYANRSMSFLKLERWAEAERDASAALRLDAAYLKAHQRRGVARRRLGKFLEATMDYENALLLEPNSKVLREDRAACKSAYEQQANTRVTAARRAVAVVVARRGVDETRETRETKPAFDATRDVPTEAPPAATTGPIHLRETTAETPPRNGDSTARDAVESKPAIAAKTAPSRALARALACRDSKPLAAPRTCAEFEAAWKRVKSDPDDTRRRALLASVDARDVPSLFRAGVPTSVFPDVVAAALGAASKTPEGPALVAFLEALTRAPRFDVAVLFVAGGAKRAMTRAWDEAVAAAAGESAARLADTRKAYGA